MASPRAVSIRIGSIGAGAHPAADLEPVHVGEHQIEDERVEVSRALQRDAGVLRSPAMVT